MGRTGIAPKVAIVLAALILTACSRSQPNMGLNPAHTGSNAPGFGDGSGDGSESGPATPGSIREFSSRVGDTVYFSTDSTELSSNSQQMLAAQAQWLNQYSQYGITIEGHADERGTREYNIALGARRASVTKQFLVARGVNPARLKTVSYGRERPVALCPNISCWSQNRRAVTVLNGYSAAAGY